MQNNFFSSKLNTILLLVLIILMVIAIRIMLQNEETYFGVFEKQTSGDKTEEQIQLQAKNNILGDKENFVSFSILPFSKVHGIISYRGVIKGGYFFEGNVLINILDSNKKILKKSNAVAKTDWMTSGPVDFEGNIDFAGLKKGPAYLEIHNDNASGLPENDKNILIPVVIE